MQPFDLQEGCISIIGNFMWDWVSAVLKLCNKSHRGVLLVVPVALHLGCHQCHGVSVALPISLEQSVSTTVVFTVTPSSTRSLSAVVWECPVHGLTPSSYSLLPFSGAMHTGSPVGEISESAYSLALNTKQSSLLPLLA